jgi:hypothetical protein
MDMSSNTDFLPVARLPRRFFPASEAYVVAVDISSVVTLN